MAKLWKAKIAWNNPYTNPPPGMPRTLYETVYDSETIRPQEIPEIKEIIETVAKPGSGYGLHLDYIVDKKNKRQWTAEQKARLRLKNLRKRVKKKLKIDDNQLYLFGENLVEAEIQKEIDKRPDYFKGGDKHIEDARKQVEGHKRRMQEYRDKLQKENQT